MRYLLSVLLLLGVATAHANIVRYTYTNVWTHAELDGGEPPYEAPTDLLGMPMGSVGSWVMTTIKVPEPGLMELLGAGLLGMMAVRQRRRVAR